MSDHVPRTAPGERTCPIHGGRLQEELVEIQYGLPTMWSLEYMAASQTQFPLAVAYAAGGCDLSTRETEEMRAFCSTCRFKLAAWCRERATTEGLPRDSQAFLARYGDPMCD